MIRRRLAGVALLVLGLLLIGRMLSRAPVETQVIFHLGTRAPTLRALAVRYVRASDGQTVRQVAFHYGPKGTSTDPVHRTRLPPGAYRLLIDLTMEGAPPRSLERAIEVSGSNEQMTVDLEK